VMLGQPTIRLAIRLVCGAMLLVVAVWTDQPSWAQKQKVSFAGTVKEVAKDKLSILEPMDTLTVIDVRGNAQVTVEGMSAAESLGPGVVVQFTADLNKADVAQSPLTELTICSITEKDQALCILADPTKASKKGAGAVNKYLVRGTIKTVKQGKLAVTVPPKQTITVQLAPDAKVKVLFVDLASVQPGDSAEVKGTELPSGEIRARTVLITMAKPYVPPKKEEPLRKKPRGK
jgi:hypothetical protein